MNLVLYKLSSTVTIKNTIISFIIGICPIGWFLWNHSMKPALNDISALSNSEIVTIKDKLTDQLYLTLLILLLLFFITLILLAIIIGYLVLWLFTISFFYLFQYRKMTDEEKKIINLESELAKKKDVYNYLRPKVHTNLFGKRISDEISESRDITLSNLKDKIFVLEFKIYYLKEWKQLRYSQKINYFCGLSLHEREALLSSFDLRNAEINSFVDLNNVISNLMAEEDLTPAQQVLIINQTKKSIKDLLEYENKRENLK